jgi:hypothetical protein
MIRWSSIRGVRFAVLEDVIFVDLPGAQTAGSSMTVAREATPGKSRSRTVRPPGQKPARPKTRGTRGREQG